LLLLLIGHVQACEDYFVVFLVNARHLNPSHSQSFLKSVAKHPRDGSKNGDVGHAWIYLKGDQVIEGGHSGELGVQQPCYMEGVLDNVALGSKNPVSYLWCHQCDGFFQEGNGGHEPTFAAKVLLSKAQYLEIYSFLRNYSFQDYCLRDRQCCTFVQAIGNIIGLNLEDQEVLTIDPYIKIGKYQYKLWEDSRYQYLSYGSPDRMELSLKQLVADGKAENVTKWYRSNHRKCLKCQFKMALKTLYRFPFRFIRYCQL